MVLPLAQVVLAVEVLVEITTEQRTRVVVVVVRVVLVVRVL